MVSVELLKGFLDISVKFFGSVSARLVDLGVIEEGHTLINVLALIHNYQGYTLVCCKDNLGGVFPECFDGLPLLFSDVVSVPLLVLEVL